VSTDGNKAYAISRSRSHLTAPERDKAPAHPARAVLVCSLPMSAHVPPSNRPQTSHGSQLSVFLELLEGPPRAAVPANCCRFEFAVELVPVGASNRAAAAEQQNIDAVPFQREHGKMGQRLFATCVGSKCQFNSPCFASSLVSWDCSLYMD